MPAQHAEYADLVIIVPTVAMPLQAKAVSSATITVGLGSTVLSVEVLTMSHHLAPALFAPLVQLAVLVSTVVAFHQAIASRLGRNSYKSTPNQDLESLKRKYCILSHLYMHYI